MQKQDKKELVEKEEGLKEGYDSCLTIISNWFKIPLFRNSIIISSVFALAIHVLYSLPAPCAFFVHKWEAGDILTYVSTIALGLLAVWQNQKFKEENDKSQESMERQNGEAQARLERINNEANELSIISRIIDQENQYLIRLEKASHEFLATSSMTRLRDVWYLYKKEDNPVLLTTVNEEARHAYDRVMSTYLTGMRTEGADIKRLMTSLGKVHETLSNLYVKVLNEGEFDNSYIVNNYFVYEEAENILDSFLFERRKLIYRVLTEKMSLEQVRSMYSVQEGNIDIDFKKKTDND